MSSKTSPARRTAAPRKKEGKIEIVVRRGAIRRFDALKTRTSELPVVVTWDRRTTDEGRDVRDTDRLKRERRQADRRRKPPFTWDLADFVVVEPVKGRRPPGRKTRKKS
jgi:hypothetical protein